MARASLLVVPLLGVGLTLSLLRCSGNIGAIKELHY